MPNAPKTCRRERTARAALAIALAFATACAASRKEFGPREDLLQDTYGYYTLPKCGDEPPGDWPALERTALETAFSVTIGGTFTRDAQNAVELLSLHLHEHRDADGCESVREPPAVALRIVTSDGKAQAVPGPAVEPALGVDTLEPPARTGAAAQLDIWRFCYDLTMRPDIARVELLDGSRTLLVLERPPSDLLEVRISPDEPAAAFLYENDDAQYAIASMHVETSTGMCGSRSIAQRTGPGFLGLGGSCWSRWRSHFESHDEVDPGQDHQEYFYGDRTSGDPAELVVSDLFHRFRFALPFTASCMFSKNP